MKKILAVAAFAFAFSVNGYAQEAAAPADSSAPAAQKCCLPNPFGKGFLHRVGVKPSVPLTMKLLDLNLQPIL